MKRDRGYYRSQRKRTIRRKQNILYGLGGQECLNAWTHGSSGRLAKGKIHCSCPMCRTKSYDDPTIRDKRFREKALSMIQDYNADDSLR